MRKADPARIAMYFATHIRDFRAKNLGKNSSENGAVEPDGKRRAYILDSLRNPAEVVLLRRVYQESFCLIGVIANELTRSERLRKKHISAGSDKIRELMDRDEKAENKNGQQVSDTFHLADFFIDNDTERFLEKGKANPEWGVSEELGRLVDILIDLVAKISDQEGYCAIQCKFYDENHKITKAEIDSFFTASGNPFVAISPILAGKPDNIGR